jgi:hypothetical protein
VFIEEQIERHGIRNFIESDFADLGELAKLADVIRNAIKYGTEETNKQIEVYHRLRQPSTQPDSRANSVVENSSTWGRRYDARTNSERGRVHRDASQGTGVLSTNPSEEKTLLRDEIERELGNGEQTMFSTKRKAPETVSVQDEHLQTVVSSADGAKVLKDLDSAITEYENDTHTKEKTFLGRLAKILGATKHGSNSQYATFETMNGNIVTIRLSNHNARVSTFDNHNEQEGISIIVTAQDNNGVDNDGTAHVVEFFYDAIKLRKADGKPLVEILKSIKQSLYSGVYKDTTGLAEREEVNTMFSTVYHDSDLKIEDRTMFSFAKTLEEFDIVQREAERQKGIVAPGLAESLFDVVDVPRHDFTGRGIDAINKARAWAIDNIQKEHIYHEGEEDSFKYEIDEEAIGKFLSSSSTTGSDNLGVHLAVLKKLPEVIDKSIEVEIHPDYKKKDGKRRAENGVDKDNLLVTVCMAQL